MALLDDIIDGIEKFLQDTGHRPRYVIIPERYRNEVVTSSRTYIDSNIFVEMVAGSQIIFDRHISSFYCADTFEFEVNGPIIINQENPDTSRLFQEFRDVIQRNVGIPSAFLTGRDLAMCSVATMSSNGCLSLTSEVKKRNDEQVSSLMTSLSNDQLKKVIEEAKELILVKEHTIGKKKEEPKKEEIPVDTQGLADGRSGVTQEDVEMLLDLWKR
jgi:hypothetical protein